MGVRLVPGMRLPHIRRPPGWLRRSAWRLDGFDVQSEPFERPADESPRREFFPDRRMGARNTGTRVDDSAIASNCLRQGLGPVERGAELAEDFDAAGVCDRVFALNPVPQGGSMGTERPGRGNPGRFTWNDGKRRFCHISCPVFPMSTTNGLRRIV